LRNFAPDYLGFCPNFQQIKNFGFAPDYLGFCPNFQQIKNFGGEFSRLASTPVRGSTSHVYYENLYNRLSAHFLNRVLIVTEAFPWSLTIPQITVWVYFT